MNRTILAATVTGLTLLASHPGRADQFAVRISSAFDGASSGLLTSLRVTEVDNFTVNGEFFLILDAPDEAYVEAYVFAIGRRAIELNALDADWTHFTVAEMPLETRLGFLRPLACNFCSI